MKVPRKVPPIKLEAAVERDFYESSITFVGKPRRPVRVSGDSSYNAEGLPRLQRGQVTLQLAEVLITVAILAMAVAFPIMVGMRGRFTPLKFDPPFRYGSSEDVAEPESEAPPEPEAPAQDPLIMLR